LGSGRGAVRPPNDQNFWSSRLRGTHSSSPALMQEGARRRARNRIEQGWGLGEAGDEGALGLTGLGERGGRDPDLFDDAVTDL